MFSIIISEKGGAERRETFDKNEINVGRVQGNDLMLPKGNVSKHHARLLYRDGRFIVTDLKSTNGTYVNGRKIAQATIVREGDKIYIGDFVLRLDTGAGASAALEAQGDEESVRTLARAGNASAAQQAQAQAPSIPAALAASPRGGAAPAYGGEAAAAEEEADRPVPKAAPAVARGGGGGGGGGAGGAAAQQAIPRGTVQMAGNARSAAAASAVAARAAVQPSSPAPAVAPAPIAPPPPVRVAPRETAQQAARRLALITLVDRIADAMDLAPLKSAPTVDEALSQLVERTAREQASAMRDEGEAPEGTDLEQLVRDALRELVGLGPIGPLLEDDEVAEIHVLRNDQVIATRGGDLVLADASFTSEEALARVVARLAQQSGEPWRSGEAVVERRLARGAQMVAIAPPVAAGHVLVIRKRRKVDATLEDLVRSGAMSRPMAVFLDACVQARANMIVCGPSGRATMMLLAALCSAAPAGERIALVQEGGEELAIPQAQTITLAPTEQARAEETLRAAAKLSPDRLVVGPLASNAAAATIEVMAEGAEGVLAATCAPTLRQGLARVVGQLVMARPGLGADTARDCVGESFDVAIELAPMADGRPRVTRIAELAGSDAKGITVRDLFTFTADASGEGTFVATGVVPRVAAEFLARGVKVDANVFKRSVGR